MTEPDRQTQFQAELASEFVIVRSLGEGSVAHVYLAREKALERLVAIKVMKSHVAEDETARKRFAREARSAAKIHHRNVATVYRVGSLEDETPFIVMEYIEGRNLADTLKAEGVMTLEQASHTLGQLASALAAAHENGIVHRDVKPENVVREKDSNRIVLMDFGLVGILETGSDPVTHLTQAGQLLGDARYLSPEQLLGNGVTDESDVYALGVIGYELLTLKTPYEGSTSAHLVMARLREEPVPLAQLRPDMDPDLAELLARCLSKNPHHRPPASEVAKALVRITEALAAGLRRESDSTPPPRTTRRLSAIMFTDMVGFTALMQDDEHRAKSVRDRHRSALRKSIETHGGEIVQFYGDGTLSIFGSAVEGVSSAVAVQQVLQQEPPIPVRIGLHIGDINRDEDGVYGDGVNVAARIQGLSVPGAVMISEKVFDEIKNHPRLPVTELGEFDLKNVRRPVRVFAITAPGLVVPDAESMAGRTELA